MNIIRNLKAMCALFFLLNLTASAQNSINNNSNWILRADKAAKYWDRAYPIGNGNLGTLNLGSFPEEHIFLNHDTIWSNSGVRKVAKNSRKKDMDEAYKLCLEGKYKEAEGVYARAKNKGNRISSFQYLGDFKIKHLSSPKATKTTRQLNLLTGESLSKTQTQSGEITQTILASKPNQCLLIKLKSTEKKGLHCSFDLNRSAGIQWIKADKDLLSFKGSTGNKGTSFTSIVKIIPSKGGKLSVDGKKLILKGAKEAMLVITASTNHNRQNPQQARTDKWDQEAKNTLDKALKLGWKKLEKKAIKDHRRLMKRCVIDLGTTSKSISVLSTPERIELIRKGGYDADLLESFFQLGRHMLISSSRPGSMPPNLQGLWAANLRPAWNGDYHLNVNVQMNYWAANTTGLSECNEPLFTLMKLLRKNGKNTAESLGCRGYAAGLASDGWGQSDWIGGSLEWDSFILGGHWLQAPLMEHYRVTRSKKVLKEEAWPTLVEGCKFLFDWMRVDAQGKLVGGPASSPENVFWYKDAQGRQQRVQLSIGNTFDHAIAWETFTDTLEAAKILKINNAFTKEVAAKLKLIPKTRIAPDGRIMEWHKNFREEWKGHRHKSHLYGFFPGKQFNSNDKKLFEAAKKSLDVRMDRKNGDAGGGGQTGWNLAWSANLWARLQEGDKALDIVMRQLRTQVNENLFNRCGNPYQIDGNLGSPAALAEMLIQSHESGPKNIPIIRLIPALAKEFKNGSAKGLRTRGGFTVDMEWQSGRITKAKIKSKFKAKVYIIINGQKKLLKMKKGQTIKL